MYKITEDEFWSAIENSTHHKNLLSSMDYVNVMYAEDVTESAYQVDTNDYEYVIIYEYDDERENKYYGTK